MLGRGRRSCWTSSIGFSWSPLRFRGGGGERLTRLLLIEKTGHSADADVVRYCLSGAIFLDDIWRLGRFFFILVMTDQQALVYIHPNGLCRKDDSLCGLDREM